MNDERKVRRPMAAVIGNSVARADVERCAETLGRALVDAGFRIISGGLGGVMDAASRGARSSAAWRDGDVVGVIPGYDATAVSDHVDICVATGMGWARNVVIVASADVVIAIGGGSGTLSEIAFAWQLGKPIVALDLGEGWSHELAGRALDDRRGDVILRAETPEDAARLAWEVVSGKKD